MIALLIDADHVWSGVNIPSNGSKPTIAQPVIAIGMTSVTQKIMDTRKMTRASFPWPVRPSGVGATATSPMTINPTSTIRNRTRALFCFIAHRLPSFAKPK